MTKNKSIRFQARQGDVMIVPCNSIPAKLKRTKRVTLAFGEATGHHHTIERGAVGYADNEVSLAEYLEVEEALALLEHQEHDAIEIPKGKYQVIRQFEYSPAELKRVTD
jgi:hypothetical protein